MVDFSLLMPQRIQFGNGSLARLAEFVGPKGKRVLLVSGSRWFDASGWRRRVENLLAGYRVENVTCREGEPDTDSVAEARAQAAAFSPDVIVAVGGGSVLDTAKAVSVLLRLPGAVGDYLEGAPGAKPVAVSGVPWIGVPSTAGTGAEATMNAVIRSRSLGAKRSMRAPALLAQTVIADPELTVDLPAWTTGTSGLDALTQLVEAYVSRRSTPPVRALVRHAFPLMLAALQGIAVDPGNLRLRSDALYGALVSGVALANAGLGAAHGFASGIGGAYDIAHGLICAVFLPHVLQTNAGVISEAIGELVGPEGGADPVAWLAARVRSLLDAYRLPGDLTAYGIPREKAGELADLSSGSSMKGNPRELTREEKVDLISRVI